MDTSDYSKVKEKVTTRFMKMIKGKQEFLNSAGSSLSVHLWNFQAAVNFRTINHFPASELELKVASCIGQNLR